MSQNKTKRSLTDVVLTQRIGIRSPGKINRVRSLWVKWLGLGLMVRARARARVRVRATATARARVCSKISFVNCIG